ncbi:hypothetical protein [Marinimicrobium sp. ARAG 43.8]|uniref:hypothetical protein n=1 Tax=Marinimicrobium sp. ARAG 43.8 TaxID=3418719 RepID=UPI003CEF55E8
MNGKFRTPRHLRGIPHFVGFGALRKGFGLWLLLVSFRVFSGETFTLAPGLTVNLPDALPVQVAELQSSNESPVLMGYVEGAPAYFLSATRIPQWQRTNLAWTKLDLALSDSSDDGHIQIKTNGRFKTRLDVEVWYRAYEFSNGGDIQRPVYFLLKGHYQLYWLTLTVAEGVNTEVVLPMAEVLVRRMEIEAVRHP